MPKLKIAWFSAGVSSMVATFLTPDIDKIIYIHIDDQHEDSIRFVKDSERLFNKEIEIVQSDRYKNVADCILGHGFIRNPYSMYHPCTSVLKRQVRKDWEEQHKNYDLTYVWGMDLNEGLGSDNRAKRLMSSNPDYQHEFPLITKQLTKQEAHGICSCEGIKRPLMYDLGFHNNNCVGCVKGGFWYWNHIRKIFPDVFDAWSKHERTLGASILHDKNGAVYLDELDPKRGKKTEEISIDCNVACLMRGF